MTISARWLGLALAVLVACGVGLRFHELEKRSLWSDELFTLAIARYYPLLPAGGQPLYQRTDVHHIGDGDTFLTAKAAEQSPPLNDLLEKATVNWLGATELAARLPAALAACALLLWFAAFAWRHPDAPVRRVLRWSLLLLVFYPALVMYAQEGRAYSVGVSTAGMAALLWLLRWRDGWRNWQAPYWTEIVLFALACYSHYTAAALVMLLLSADAVMAHRRRSSKAWLRLGALGLVFLAWLALNLHTILFTSRGGVAWASASAWERVLMTLNDAPAVIHLPWLGLALLVLAALLLLRWRQGLAVWPDQLAVRLGVLAGLALAYVALAGLIAAKAGMAHPRFYIFIVPLVAVMVALVLAELRPAAAVAGALLLVLALAQPAARLTASNGQDDFRAMSVAAVRGATKETLFLYPWPANRNIYRIYLERFLGRDLRSRMVGATLPKDAVQTCQQLGQAQHVVALGHDTGKEVIDAVYAACGVQWPRRSHEQFFNTFAEHWQAP